MNASTEWNPSVLLKSPILAPLHPVITHLQSSQFPTLPELNELLGKTQPPIQVQLGHPLHFVPQEQGRMGFEAQYEPRCYLSGEVQTRPDNWHDLFNALVWLTFPKAKAAINALHYQTLIANPDSNGSQRGKVRDTATLLDESGVIVVCANTDLAELLCTFQWKELFWQCREQVRAEMGFYVFGHGLYEKAIEPYVGMTGQGLMLNVPTDFFTWALSVQLSYLDEKIAEYLQCPDHCLSPRKLHPVPLLGVPGWSEDNEFAGFYDNTEYFRAGRREPK